jgi:hypothetical protein
MHEDPVIQKFIDSATTDRNRNVQNSNDTENALCASLILVCTVFLTVLVVVLGNADILSKVSPFGKILLVAGLITIIGSMGCGIKHYFVNVRFYRDAAKIHHTDIELLNEVDDKNYKKITKSMGENEEKLIPEADDRWLLLQVRLRATVALVFILFVVSILFNFGLKY